MRLQILKLAIPSIISNLTVPLMGLVDVAIVGHLSNPTYIGAIALGGMMFSLLYWGFVFLRMGTGGLTAQAYGRKDQQDIPLQLFRPILLALGISLLILLLHRPLEWLILTYMGEPGTELNQNASLYFRICVWGAPAVLSMYALNGWFVGMQNTRITMFVAVLQNLLNIVFSLFFVYGLDMEISGVALGTLLGQWSGFLLAIFWCYRKFGFYFKRPFSRTEILDKQALVQYFHVNHPIFGRTLCLVAVTVSFTSFGARQGEDMLAVNTLMMQMFTIFSYFMDGFAYAAEALCGACYGEGSLFHLKKTISSLFFWGWILMLIFCCLYGFGGRIFLGILTDQERVLLACEPYVKWVTLIPLCSFAAFLWDGVYVGLTETKVMFQVMLSVMILYFCVYLCAFPILGNHGLWIAFLAYLLVRGVGMWLAFPRTSSYQELLINKKGSE